MKGKLMKPKIDFAFKEIMMDSEVRRGFLSAVLKLKPEDIKETKILNTYLRKKHKNVKHGPAGLCFMFPKWLQNRLKKGRIILK